MDIPDLQPYHPKLGNRFTRFIGRQLLRLIGWKIQGPFPKEKKLVVCIAPHTSNMDFFVAIFAILAMGLKATWMGKKQIFVWPVKGLLLKLGGKAVDRSNPKGMVGQVVEELNKADSMIYALAPEGTRKRVDNWKTGFLRIAKDANVPVGLAALDFKQKKLIFGPVMDITDIDADMVTIRKYYQSIPAKYPQNTN